MELTNCTLEMELDLIITFEDSPQEFHNISTLPQHFETAETLLKHIVEELEYSKTEVLLIRKISCCTNIEKYLLPEWYFEENGKIYMEHGEITL